jgi:hypothetical protein
MAENKDFDLRQREAELKGVDRVSISSDHGTVHMTGGELHALANGKLLAHPATRLMADVIREATGQTGQRLAGSLEHMIEHICELADNMIADGIAPVLADKLVWNALLGTPSDYPLEAKFTINLAVRPYVEKEKK